MLLESKMRAAVLLWLVAALAVATGVVDAKYEWRGSEKGLAALQSDVNVTVRRTKGVGYEFLISPAIPVPVPAGGPNVTRGIVIIPEDQVAPEAYAPLARALALMGCYSAIIDTPTPGRAIQAMMLKPDLEHWTLAGHGRTGGALASRLVLTLQPKVKGLILMASAMPADVDMTDLNVAVLALYGGRDTVVTPEAVEGSFVRFPGDAGVLAFGELGHYDFAYSECVGNAILPEPKALTDADFSNIVEKSFTTILLSPWNGAGKKALSFSNNESLMPGKNISKPYLGDIRVHYTKLPIPNTWPQRWWWVFTPTVIKGGLIYYPGAGVDARAYFPLAFEIAARGHLVVIVQMPFRFALPYFKEANVIIDSPYFHQVPNGTWAIGGHSLGGVTASRYVACCGERIYAAVMHAGGWFPNVTQNPLPMVNIYGTLDDLAPGGYDRYRYLYTDPPPKGHGPLVNLKTTKFVVVEGANHYQMGDYGYQKPDEVAIISMEEQWKEFAKESIAFLEGVLEGVVAAN